MTIEKILEKIDALANLTTTADVTESSDDIKSALFEMGQLAIKTDTSIANNSNQKLHETVSNSINFAKKNIRGDWQVFIDNAFKNHVEQLVANKKDLLTNLLNFLQPNKERITEENRLRVLNENYDNVSKAIFKLAKFLAYVKNNNYEAAQIATIGVITKLTYALGLTAQKILSNSFSPEIIKQIETLNQINSNISQLSEKSRNGFISVDIAEPLLNSQNDNYEAQLKYLLDLINEKVKTLDVSKSEIFKNLANSQLSMDYVMTFKDEANRTAGINAHFEKLKNNHNLAIISNNEVSALDPLLNVKNFIIALILSLNSTTNLLQQQAIYTCIIEAGDFLDTFSRLYTAEEKRKNIKLPEDTPSADIKKFQPTIIKDEQGHIIGERDVPNFEEAHKAYTPPPSPQIPDDNSSKGASAEETPKNNHIQANNGASRARGIGRGLGGSTSVVNTPHELSNTVSPVPMPQNTNNNANSPEDKKPQVSAQQKEQNNPEARGNNPAVQGGAEFRGNTRGAFRGRGNPPSRGGNPGQRGMPFNRGNMAPHVPTTTSDQPVVNNNTPPVNANAPVTSSSIIITEKLKEASNNNNLGNRTPLNRPAPNPNQRPRAATNNRNLPATPQPKSDPAPVVTPEPIPVVFTPSASNMAEDNSFKEISLDFGEAPSRLPPPPPTEDADLIPTEETNVSSSPEKTANTTFSVFTTEEYKNTMSNSLQGRRNNIADSSSDEEDTNESLNM